MSKRFRVAFSFSAEKRPFIADVARILASHFGSDRILYDKFHEAEFARGDLAFHLASVYHDHTDLVVVALASGYERREWCGLEWGAIYPQLRKGQWESVMLCRWDHVEGAGLYGVEGFVDLDRRTPDDAANLILQRLARQEGHPVDYYSRASLELDWPEIAPPLEWSVADLNEARRAFSQLITRVAPFRVLLVHGGSETGKSHFTKRCLANALKIPGLRCGRFDFRGDWQSMSQLAQTLDVSVPASGTSVSIQLGSILSALRASPRPTLLLLDTFEMAGEAERWVRDVLLLTTIRAPWLRLVIAGQRVPSGYGEPWSSAAAPPIELVPPSAQDWFEYGRQYKTDLTLEFVTQAHQMTAGKNSILAQLLGPSAR